MSFEVIYVDNASKDGSVDMVRKEFPGVRIIQNEKNEGFIKANNQGIKVAQGRYTLLLNSDTIVLDNAIAKMVKFADDHADAAVVGCKIVNPDRTLRRTCFMYPCVLNMFLSAIYLNKIFPKSRFFGRQRMTWWEFNDVREVQTVCGCCLLARKEAIEQVGLMDETYYVYGDDPDWCYRFKKNGWKIMFTPDPEVIHLKGQTTRKMKREFRLQLCGSSLIFMKLHRSKLDFQVARFLSALFFLLRIPYWFAVAMLCGDERRTSIETIKTYLLGSLYCVGNWKKLLMNREAVEGKL
jgi:GT2 family glycosyltransferase